MSKRPLTLQLDGEDAVAQPVVKKPRVELPAPTSPSPSIHLELDPMLLAPWPDVTPRQLVQFPIGSRIAWIEWNGEERAGTVLGTGGGRCELIVFVDAKFHAERAEPLARLDDSMLLMESWKPKWKRID